MKLICEICGEKFEAVQSRPHGNHCKTCSGFLSVLDKGPYQSHDNENDEKFGMVVVYLLLKDKGEGGTGDLGKAFIQGLIKGIRKT